jgi:hypothetical protein
VKYDYIKLYVQDIELYWSLPKNYLNEIIIIIDLEMGARVPVLYHTSSFIVLPVHCWQRAFDADWIGGWMVPRTGLTVEAERWVLYLLGIKLRSSAPLSAMSKLCPWCSRRSGKTMSVNCGHQQAYSSSRRWYISMESHCGMTLAGENRRTRIKTYQSATLSIKNSIWTGA